MEDHSGAGIHLQAQEDSASEHMDMLGRDCEPWEDPWEDPTLEQIYWKDLWPHGGPRLEQPIPEGLDYVEGTHTGAVSEL